MTNTITRLRSLLEKATPGPWKLHFSDGCDLPKYPEGYSAYPVAEALDNETSVSILAQCAPKRGRPNWENAELIVAAVNALPALINIAEAAERHRKCVGWDSDEQTALEEIHKALDKLNAKGDQ